MKKSKLVTGVLGMGALAAGENEFAVRGGGPQLCTPDNKYYYSTGGSYLSKFDNEGNSIWNSNLIQLGGPSYLHCAKDGILLGGGGANTGVVNPIVAKINYTTGEAIFANYYPGYISGITVNSIVDDGDSYMCIAGTDSGSPWPTVFFRISKNDGAYQNSAAFNTTYYSGSIGGGKNAMGDYYTLGFHNTGTHDVPWLQLWNKDLSFNKGWVIDNPAAYQEPALRAQYAVQQGNEFIIAVDASDQNIPIVKLDIDDGSATGIFIVRNNPIDLQATYISKRTSNDNLLVSGRGTIVELTPNLDVVSVRQMANPRDKDIHAVHESSDKNSFIFSTGDYAIVKTNSSLQMSECPDFLTDKTNEFKSSIIPQATASFAATPIPTNGITATHFQMTASTMSVKVTTSPADLAKTCAKIKPTSTTTTHTPTITPWTTLNPASTTTTPTTRSWTTLGPTITSTSTSSSSSSTSTSASTTTPTPTPTPSPNKGTLDKVAVELKFASNMDRTTFDNQHGEFEDLLNSCIEQGGTNCQTSSQENYASLPQYKSRRSQSQKHKLSRRETNAYQVKYFNELNNGAGFNSDLYSYAYRDSNGNCLPHTDAPSSLAQAFCYVSQAVLTGAVSFAATHLTGIDGTNNTGTAVAPYQQPDNGGSDVPLAAIVGGAVGGAVVLGAVAGGLGYYMYRRNKKNKENTTETNSSLQIS